ncbi:MAG TPA: LacI family DNA-binding transcriptional regulator [Baekduia sp.]|nr:LacI family DNA-binding transcriptional regulator [Baekduia sp.]
MTIRDVAHEAGVSITTVSDALNGRGRLADETRDRIQEVARRMGYRARASARNLRGGRTGQIALYCSFLTEVPGGMAGLGYYMALAMGAAETALAEDIGLVLLPTGLTPERLAAVEVDGLIVADPVMGDPGVRAVADLGLTVVTCERDPTPGAAHAGCIRSDHRAALRGLLEHLADQGAGRIALIAAGDETAWTQELGAAYDAWCAEQGSPRLFERVAISPLPHFTAAATAALLDAPEPPDAIVCAPDGGAPHVLRVLEERGLRVPDDVLVAAGVDGPLMPVAMPPVTAIDLAPAEAGRRAASMLAAILRGDLEPGIEEDLPTRLNVRASTTNTTTAEVRA